MARNWGFGWGSSGLWSSTVTAFACIVRGKKEETSLRVRLPRFKLIILEHNYPPKHKVRCHWLFVFGTFRFHVMVILPIIKVF